MKRLFEKIGGWNLFISPKTLEHTRLCRKTILSFYVHLDYTINDCYYFKFQIAIEVKKDNLDEFSQGKHKSYNIIIKWISTSISPS